MECIQIKLFKCPKCERVLKPSTIDGVLTITDYRHKITKKVKHHDILICRYCNIFVKAENLRQQKDPLKFLEQFKFLPKNNEMKDEGLHKIRLRDQEVDNLKRFKHPYTPEKCPECNSGDIFADSCDYGWFCMNCDSYFQWQKFLVMFHGDCEVYARDEDEAIEKGYYALENEEVDIETDVM